MVQAQFVLVHHKQFWFSNTTCLGPTLGRVEIYDYRSLLYVLYFFYFATLVSHSEAFTRIYIYVTCSRYY